MRKALIFVLCTGLACSAQTVLPEGTKLRVRLDQTISSATADEGQTVELSVTDPVKVGDVLVIAEGARATGTVMVAQEKRRLGRSGKLDFSIDRVKTVDNQWVPLRYTITKKSGQSHAVSTGVLTASAAVLFWPAAPVFLLRKGQDITINKGVVFEVFTDANAALADTASDSRPPAAVDARQGVATIVITSPASSADIELDGVFAGNTPATLRVPSGQHQVTVKHGVKIWQRTVQVSAGSSITLNAVP